MCNAGPPPYYAVFLISAQSTKLSTRRHHCTLDFPSVFGLDIDIVNAKCSNSSRTSVSKCKRIFCHLPTTTRRRDAVSLNLKCTTRDVV
ncbi:hypothetical protein QR685DRAFT_573723 [Neurospora intermedia]|uniref:Uncharacterized protein n=1 Tax=Neurospora intermedia TaxID=5142 RepID=A0ABR3D751_NEUIN